MGNENYNSRLQTNNSELSEIKQTINNLPPAQKPEVMGKKVITKNGYQTFTPPEGKTFSTFTADVNVKGSDVSPFTRVTIEEWTPSSDVNDYYTPTEKDFSYLGIFPKKYNVDNWPGNHMIEFSLIVNQNSQNSQYHPLCSGLTSLNPGERPSGCTSVFLGNYIRLYNPLPGGKTFIRITGYGTF